MPSNSLTTRELEIARLIATGISNKRVASTLGITHGTVRIHLANIYRKTGMLNRTMLALQYPAYDKEHIEAE